MKYCNNRLPNHSFLLLLFICTFQLFTNSAYACELFTDPIHKSDSARNRNVHWIFGASLNLTWESTDLTSGGHGVHLGKEKNLNSKWSWMTDLGYFHAYGVKVDQARYPPVEEFYLHIGPKYSITNNLFVSLGIGIHATVRHYILIDNFKEAVSTFGLQFGYDHKLGKGHSIRTSACINHFGAHFYRINYIGLRCSFIY